MVYQDVTRDSSLPLAAKGLYAYLAAFCGSTDECYPSVETVLRETGISKETFYKYIGVLVKAGVVEKKQLNENGRFGRTVYKITHEVTVSNLPYTDIPTTVKPNTRKPTTEKPTTRNPTTNNNNINSNNINNNNNKYMYVQPEVDTPPEAIKKKKTSRFIPPTVEEVRQYCQENDYILDSQRFVDFYECKGWMVGKNKMKNWKAAVRTWARKDQGGVIRDEPEPTNSIRLW